MICFQVEFHFEVWVLGPGFNNSQAKEYHYPDCQLGLDGFAAVQGFRGHHRTADMCSRTIYLRFEKKEREIEQIVDRKCLVFFTKNCSGLQSLYVLSKKPSVGINVVMMLRVAFSVVR